MAISWVALSRTRTGRSTQPVRRNAAATASSMAPASPAAMPAQPLTMREERAPVGESMTTTAITSPSLITGEATISRLSRCHGQTCGGPWLRRPARASLNSWPCAPPGASQPAGAAAIGLPSRWKTPARIPYTSW